MKQQLYEKMESMFHLIAHDYQPATPLEILCTQLARGNAFDMRVVGLEGVRRLRSQDPDCAITFKPNHLSEADFILLTLLFRENQLRVLIEGGANLFIEDIDLLQDVLPDMMGPGAKQWLENRHMSMAQYLTRRGSFKVYREPQKVTLENGEEHDLNRKEILSLTRAYRYHLVKQKSMYVTFPGYSPVKTGLLDILKKNEMKTGRSYTGQIEGFHHLPFQMDIEASLFSTTKVYIVDVNIAYEKILEDELFAELARLHDIGKSKKEIYAQDLDYILRGFLGQRPTANLSIKFGEPRLVPAAALKDPFLTRKIKNSAHEQAARSYDTVMTMQPIFPANIYFSAFDANFNRLGEHVLLERINNLRQQLPNLTYGRDNRPLDLHYLLDYNHQIISANEIINRTLRLFNTPGHITTTRDGDMFAVYNKDVASQYRNHTAHFFKTQAR